MYVVNNAVKLTSVENNLMHLDVEHVLFWMDAIRNSNDPYRTLESFWKGQIRSKLWLINAIKSVKHQCDSISVDIHGGWNGVLASLLFQSDITISRIRSVDIDRNCKDIAITINKIEEIAGKFEAETCDMCDIVYDQYDVVINTSCEHISQEQYDKWLSNRSENSLLIVQSNNYNIPEHIRLAKSLVHFKEQCKLNILWSGELELPLYTRYMIIGNKQ